MAYNKTTWSDLPSQTTPVNATNLNNIENGIKENDDRLNGTKPMGSIVVDDVSCKNIFSGFSNGTYDSSTGAYNPSGNDISTAKIPVTSGQSYYLSGIGGSQTIRVLYWNNNTYVTSEVINVVSTGNVITPQGNYLAIQTGTGATYSNVQLEKGSEATTYTPHKNFDGEVYSESEIKIGTWINGKPIYRKTYELTNITSSNTDVLTLQNVDLVVNLYGTLVTTYAQYPIPTYDTSSNYCCFFWRPGTNAVRGRAVVGDGGTFQKAYITLEYTKKTATRSITPTEEETR